ncbi:MAG: hypothetical protein R6U50_08395 [Desulfobacterales bacterium]
MSIVKTDRLIRVNDFEAALAENQKISEHPLGMHDDMALFQRAVILGHPHNPNRDAEKSAACFREMIDEHPDSCLVEPARMLVFYFDRYESMSYEYDGRIEELEGTIAELKTAAEAYQKKVSCQKTEMGDLKDRIAELESQIEEYKSIDLNMEDRKQK